MDTCIANRTPLNIRLWILFDNHLGYQIYFSTDRDNNQLSEKVP